MPLRLSGSWGPHHTIQFSPSLLSSFTCLCSGASSPTAAENGSFLAFPTTLASSGLPAAHSIHLFFPRHCRGAQLSCKADPILLMAPTKSPKGSMSPSIMPGEPPGSCLSRPSHVSYRLLALLFLLHPHCQFPGSLWLLLRSQSNILFQDTELPCAPLHSPRLGPATPTSPPPSLGSPWGLASAFNTVC